MPARAGGGRAQVNNSYGGLVTKVEMGVFQTERAVMQSVPDIPFGREGFYTMRQIMSHRIKLLRSKTDVWDTLN